MLDAVHAGPEHLADRGQGVRVSGHRQPGRAVTTFRETGDKFRESISRENLESAGAAKRLKPVTELAPVLCALASDAVRAVLVVAAVDSATVEARLRQQLGKRLCVVASHWTRHDIDAVRGRLRRHQEDWNIYASAVEASEDAQAFVTAGLTQVLPETAAWAATLLPASSPSGRGSSRRVPSGKARTPAPNGRHAELPRMRRTKARE